MPDEELELIDLVQQYSVLYDNKSKEYKDQDIRNAVWEEIAKELNRPVNNCKDDWTRLRNSFASVLKRRRKKGGQATTPLVPWKYEEQMIFLLPFMETRQKKKRNIAFVSRESVRRSASPYYLSPKRESQSPTRSSIASHLHSSKDHKLETYELTKTDDLRIPQQNASKISDMDENDLFFLSMSKAVKSLPMIDQAKIKLDLHTAVSEAQIRHANGD